MLSKILSKLKKQTRKATVKVDNTMRDYSKEEFFVKKAAMAKEILSKYDLPKELAQQ